MKCGMRHLPALITALTAAAVAWSCGEERKSYVANASDVERVPTMTTTDVETFISDSGYTRYHISAPVWEIYDEAREPHWRFPSGMHMQQYDERLQPDANITCDSAIYLSNRRLWQLDGHVKMVNTARDSFLTQQLFWDQARSRVYSDSFIHIVRADRIIEGYGFESNQNMTAYTVNNPTAILPVERARQDATTTAPADTAATDSAAPAQPVHGRRSAPVRASERDRLNARPAPDAPNGLRLAPTRQQTL